MNDIINIIRLVTFQFRVNIRLLEAKGSTTNKHFVANESSIQIIRNYPLIIIVERICFENDLYYGCYIKSPVCRPCFGHVPD